MVSSERNVTTLRGDMLKLMPLLLALAFIVGLIIGDRVPSVVVGTAAMVLVFPAVLVWLLPRGVARSFQPKNPEAAEVCPRCAVRPRDPTGWCQVCFDELTEATDLAAQPLSAFIAAMYDDDWDALQALVAPTITVRMPSGQRRSLKRGAWIASAKLANSLMNLTTNQQHVVFVDPADSSATWSRARSAGQWRFVGRPFDWTVVSRYRSNQHGLVSEIESFAPLPSLPS